jgi:D-alanyl-D-alanine carboxypeptidase/D-alanyl-D-alanine-endopeptidase (penicillin-binding protein 4)
MKYLSRCFVAAVILLAMSAPAAAQESPASGQAGQVGQVDSAAQSADETSPEFERKAERLEQAIESILADSDVTRGKVGIYAVDMATGNVLYEQGADIAMNPASNTKLITGAAALDAFGPNHTFETLLLAEDVDADGMVADGVIDGPLYVKGGGDAFLLFEDFMGWAAELRQKGVREITGDIIVDDSIFAGEFLPPAFGQKDEDASYRSPIGAFSVGFNAVSVVVEPAETVGEPPSYRLVPPNEHIEVVNRATTTDGRRRRIHVVSEPIRSSGAESDGVPVGTKFIITGSIGKDARQFRSRRKRIDNPSLFSGAVLVEALEMVGIEVGGRVETGEAPESAEVLVSHSSQPLTYIVLAMNKWSNNFMAEMLLRMLGTTEGEPSTWEASQAAAMEFLKETGIDTAGIVLKNGSGLYDANRASPRQFVALLRYMKEHQWAPEFTTSLAIAGIDGTMARRLEDESVRGKVRAKTGTLNEVTALSGYLRTDSDRLVAFSIIFNDPPRYAWHYRPVQDRIAQAIEAFDE